jgi:hypothetical protein
MPHTTLERLYGLLGFIIWGDLNEVTIYRDKQGKMVWFKKTYPDKPASQAQLDNRARMTGYAADWQALSAATRAQWELATKRANLTMHGYDLFIHWKFTADDPAIRQIERQTNTALLPP